jgi:hypothetical protein
MNKSALGAIETRLIEINEIVEKLDVSIRASAFELLKGYVTEGNAHAEISGVVNRPIKSSPDPSGLSALIEAHSNEKPSDNVHLLVADWYNSYGLTPFSPNDIKKNASDSGLTVPEHLNMTLRSAQDGGKKLYQSAGRGLYKPTVTGELFLKRTYVVAKGTGIPPAAAS